MRPLTAQEYVALTTFGEARGEPLAGKLAVASVIRNRLHSGRWGPTYEAVCLAPKQFSCWNANDQNLPKLRQLADALSGGGTPTDRALRECLWIASGLVDDVFPSQVGSATHYFSSSMQTPPAWASGGHLVAVIGHHVFIEGVR